MPGVIYAASSRKDLMPDFSKCDQCGKRHAWGTAHPIDPQKVRERMEADLAAAASEVMTDAEREHVQVITRYSDLRHLLNVEKEARAESTTRQKMLSDVMTTGRAEEWVRSHKVHKAAAKALDAVLNGGTNV